MKFFFYIFLFLTQLAFAGQMGFSADFAFLVVPSCTTSGGGIFFNGYTTDSTLSATGSFSVTCSKGVAWSAAIYGQYPRTAFFSSAWSLNYELYTDPAYTTIWGDGSSVGSTILGTGTGVEQRINFYGKVPSGQTTSANLTYNSNITFIISY